MLIQTLRAENEELKNHQAQLEQLLQESHGRTAVALADVRQEADAHISLGQSEADRTIVRQDEKIESLELKVQDLKEAEIRASKAYAEEIADVQGRNAHLRIQHSKTQSDLNAKISELEGKLSASGQNATATSSTRTAEYDNLQREYDNLKRRNELLVAQSTKVAQEKMKLQDSQVKAEGPDLKARNQELEAEVEDLKTTVENLHKNIGINEQHVYSLLQERFTSSGTTSYEPASSGSKRPTPSSSSIPSASKRPKIESADFEENEPPAQPQSTRRSNVQVVGAIDGSDNLILQSGLPSTVTSEIIKWIEKLDARGMCNGRFTWLKNNPADCNSCAIAKLKRESSTWMNPDQPDAACFECSYRSRPCIIIRQNAPVLLPLIETSRQGKSPADPEYWIRPGLKHE